MTCSNCKNPVQANSNECEWCGSKIISIKSIAEKNNDFFKGFFKTKIVFIFDGLRVIGDYNVQVYINENILDKKLSLKNGFTFEIENTGVTPIIQLRIEGNRTRRLELPKLDELSNYLITIDYIWWLGRFNSKPKSIEEI